MNARATLSPPGPAQTDKTDKTDRVGNDGFPLSAFGEPANARPIVVSFQGNPATAHGKLWSGKPWLGGPDDVTGRPAGGNDDFSLAVFRSDAAGRFRRQRARFHALYAVMLDDTGTKTDLDRLTVPPSWLLETSTGNHQAGYLLREPPTCVQENTRLVIEALCRALPAANEPTCSHNATQLGNPAVVEQLKEVA